MKLLDAFGQNQKLIELSFGSRAIAGKQYFGQGRVSGINIADRSASADVRGSQRQPYSTQISLVERSGGFWLSGDCDCLYGSGCKHAAALAYAVALHAKEGPQAEPVLSAPAPEASSGGGRKPAASALEAIQRFLDRSNFQRPKVEPDHWGIWQQELQSAQVLAIPDKPVEVRPVRFVLRQLSSDLLLLPLRGKFGKQGKLSGFKTFSLDPRRIVERTVDDDPVERGLVLALNADDYREDLDQHWFRVPARADRALAAALNAGLVHLGELDGPVLKLGERRKLQLQWGLGGDGAQRLLPTVGSTLEPRVCGELWGWYLDAAAAVLGPVDTGAHKPLVSVLRRAPEVSPEQVPLISGRLKQLRLSVNLPPPVPLQLQPQPLKAPKVRLRLSARAYEADPARHLEAVIVEPQLRYGQTWIRLNPVETPVREREEQTLRVYPRDGVAELALRGFLDREGFRPGEHFDQDPLHTTLWRRPVPLRSPALIQQWLQGLLASAAKAGYELDAAPGFPFERGVVIEEFELSIEDAEGGNAWFETQLGIELDGQRIDLGPLLVAALANPSAWSQEYLRLRMADGRELLIPRERLGPILAMVNELEQRPDGKLAVARSRLHAIQVPPDMRLQVGAAAARLREQLSSYGGLQPVVLPPEFGGELRPYQAQGVSWLQFLRELNFGGVLADDMGLGKTVQVLANLCVEAAAGRLEKPALVVCPTSVVSNWEAEAERFAPHLKRVVFHGLDRARKAGELAGAQLIITSYALLVRDIELMVKIEFSWTIFDEAQWLKNSASKGFAAAIRLKSQQRLCMTGTPVENHLGELKAQFDLAFPGLLGSDRDFLQRFRNPIEKERNPVAAAQLKRRIAPFLLRRRKTEVATELPPRSTLIQHIELLGPQRDLYESIRVQMEARVREALAERGLEGSRITILDALLKLRQICCHPRLLMQESARKVQTSAKLEALTELLPTLIEDGRSVLLFSQFTSMLDLIEPELKKLEIGFERLDGSTRDRGIPVKRFQAGEVPLFLISLKAGGVGLNLTRADTVILYDPWWNPAVEQQAIDRAHRIGQDKPVFVYELSCVNTVEDKMLKLKDRKRTIAEAVLNEGEAALSKLTGAELLELFAETAVA